MHRREGSAAARVTAELEGGRFTIATDQPHVKVAWRISHRKEEPKCTNDSQQSA
jgi:hypothetical protein